MAKSRPPFKCMQKGNKNLARLSFCFLFLFFVFNALLYYTDILDFVAIKFCLRLKLTIHDDTHYRNNDIL